MDTVAVEKTAKVWYQDKDIICRSDLTVEFPSVDLLVYGGWNWGPHNPDRPHLIATLFGAKQVLIGHLEEAIRKGSLDDYKPALSVVGMHLSILTSGLPTMPWENKAVVTKKHTVIDGSVHHYTRIVEWASPNIWGDSELDITNTFTWKAQDGDIKKTFTQTNKLYRQKDIVAGRTTQEIFADIIKNERLPYFSSPDNDINRYLTKQQNKV